MYATQKDEILDHLMCDGSITSIEAIMDYGATRLADIIYKLRKDGWAIDSVDETGVNRYNRPVRYTRYVLRNCDRAND